MLIAALVASSLIVAPGGLSPHGAVEKIRAAKAAGDQSAWEVTVKAGVYELKQPLVFTPADSGTPEAPVKWVGEEGAVFAGGRQLGPWKEVDGVWETEIPRDAAGKRIYFESLYVNGRRADRARLGGEKGFHPKKCDRLPLVDDTGKTNTLYVCSFSNAEVDAIGALPEEERKYAQIRVFVKWSYGSFQISGFDVTNRAVRAVEYKWLPGWGSWRGWASDDKTYVYFENVRSGFTEPGMWFYDVVADKVRYRPLPGEVPEKSSVIAPTSQLVSLVEFRGDAAKGDFVHDITFRGLGFTASRANGRVDPETGFVEQYQHQAALNSGAAVYAFGAHRVTLDRCRIFNTDNYGVKFDEGCVSNQVIRCDIEGTGAGGVWIGGLVSRVPPAPRKNGDKPWGNAIEAFPLTNTTTTAVAFNVVENCRIRHFGRVNPEGCGVVISHGSDCRVSHNEITDGFYTGVSVGWVWGYWGSFAQRNEISFNRITDIGQSRMADMGGVYTLGTSFGTVVTNNVIMNVKSNSYGGWALYNDEGSEGVLWENNLTVNTSDDSYHIHYGRNNTVRNNILIDGAPGSKLKVSRLEDHHQVHFEHNIVAWHEGSLAGGRIAQGDAKVTWKDNLFWNFSGVTKINAPIPGTVGDPLFVDVEKGDYRLKSESPAIKLGFKPFDPSAAGPIRDRE